MEIIKIEQNQQKWDTLDRVCRVLGMRTKDTEETEKLKYQEQIRLELSNITYLELITLKKIEKLPKWISECSGLQNLILIELDLQ
jgi:hypothetical protein